MTPRVAARSLVMRLAASRWRRELRHKGAEGWRLLRRAPHRVEYFHQVDDPYSHLAAQVLRRLAETYAVTLTVHLVGPPDDTNAPERELLAAWSRRDAADVAPHYGLAFPGAGGEPDADAVELAQRVLTPRLDADDFGALAVAVGDALWSGDRARLETLAAEEGAADAAEARARVGEGSERRARLGHYAGAMFRYGGEWYWGVDRLVHLETRLAALGAVRGAQGRIAPRPPVELPDDHAPADGITVEFFPSLRSPYTAIVMRRTIAWAHAAGVRLVIRPVLPMVMRGVPVSTRKGLYIQLDAAREAELAGVPFGWIVDPVGTPVERGLALFDWARQRERGESLLLSFAEGAFMHGIDVTREHGLARVVTRAGLPWHEGRRRMRDELWRESVEANRRSLYESGLWGVPSFRVSGPAAATPFSTWGQDRLWRVAREVRRRAQAR